MGWERANEALVLGIKFILNLIIIYHHFHVKNIFLFWVVIRDEKWGEVVTALITLHDQSVLENEIEIQEIEEELKTYLRFDHFFFSFDRFKKRKKLASYKVPRRIFFIINEGNEIENQLASIKTKLLPSSFLVRNVMGKLNKKSIKTKIEEIIIL